MTINEMQQRVESIHMLDDSFMVTLKRGWKLAGSGHTFNADSKDEIREGLKKAERCQCPGCIG